MNASDRGAADRLRRAYDAVAPDYDRQMSGDAWMRQVLWDHYLRRFRPGQRVLDVSCGTGTDAIFLAQHGISVVGIDLSPGMIAALREKVAAAKVADRVQGHVLDFAELASWHTTRFDGIISAFAGLNGVADLRPFAASAARILGPGSHLIVHLLSRWSLWEALGLVAHGEWEQARDLGRRRERTFSVGGTEIRQYPFNPDETYRRFFFPWFHLERAYGLGIFRPPHTVRRIPAPLIAALGLVESGARNLPWLRGLGRLFVLDLVRRTDLVERG